MTPRKPTKERRIEIADAAIKIIGEQGLREFTAAQLARAVGIKDGTIFRHFKDKREIMTAVLDRLEEVLSARVPQPCANPLERLGDFVMLRLHSVGYQPGIQALLFSDQIAHAMGVEGQRRVAALRNRGRDFIRSCLKEAAEKGLLREEVDVEGAVLLVTGMVMSFLFAAKDGALTAPVEEMEKRSWRTLLSLLARNQVTP